MRLSALRRFEVSNIRPQMAGLHAWELGRSDSIFFISFSSFFFPLHRGMQEQGKAASIKWWGIWCCRGHAGLGIWEA
jgi:hypothetical protein